MWGVEYSKNAASFPFTKSLIEEIPFVASASFSKLEPETKIKKHTGDSNIMYRVHIPLIVPGSLPECGFKVLDESVSWELGSAFAFGIWVTVYTQHPTARSTTPPGALPARPRRSRRGRAPRVVRGWDRPAMCIAPALYAVLRTRLKQKLRRPPHLDAVE